MKTHTFLCEEHEDFGSNGWRLKTQPGWDPLGGMAVAHDVLEHFADTTDAPLHELQALGAALWIRDGGNYWGTYHPQSIYWDGGHHIAPDLITVLQHALHEGMDLPKPPRTVRCDAEDQIDIALWNARKEVTSEWEDPREARELLKLCRGWLRIGYRRAAERYKGHSPQQVVRLFREIEEQAEKALKTAEAGISKLHVTVNITELSAKVSKEDDNGDY